MFSTKKIVQQSAIVINQMATVLEKHIQHSHAMQEYQANVNSCLYDSVNTLVGYTNSLADELVGLREEVNIIRAQYAQIIQLVKEYRNDEEAG